MVSGTYPKGLNTISVNRASVKKGSMIGVKHYPNTLAVDEYNYKISDYFIKSFCINDTCQSKSSKLALTYNARFYVNAKNALSYFDGIVLMTKKYSSLTNYMYGLYPYTARFSSGYGFTRFFNVTKCKYTFYF